MTSPRSPPFQLTVAAFAMCCFWGVATVSGFAFPPAARRLAHSGAFCSGMKAAAADQGEDEKPSGLTFRGTVNLSSDPLPPGTTAADIAAFLRDPSNRNSLLSAGATRTVEQVPLTAELETLWKDACRQEYGDALLPNADDCVVVTDSITQFPGLKLVSKVYNGVKQNMDESSSGIPKYTFVLVGEELSVSGLPPVVWIFNKLTGSPKDSLKASGVALSNITALVDDNGKFVFNFDATIKIKIDFPEALLKILPTNREKAEESGSASIQKMVEKDVGKGAKGVYDAFVEYLSSTSIRAS